MRSLTETVGGVLDRRLSEDDPRPVAVALSGGGDSLALTLLADAWARRAGRELFVLTVDHGLRAESAAWTAACAATARRIGRPFRALNWTGEKPATSLPAAARAARHALLAEAARAAGARVILLGHTADDLAEAAAMRAAGSTTPDAREWGPSPAWPQGRGVFLLRPLLGVRREALRTWLRHAGEDWIDDPANTDVRFARARARQAGPSAAPEARDAAPLTLARATDECAGVLRLARADVRGAEDEAAQWLAMACVCAGGGARRPSGQRLGRLAARLRSAEVFTATLAGARIEAREDEVQVFREPGEAARGGLAPLTLCAEHASVWDGRFELPPGEGRILPLAGLARRLPRDQQAALRALPAAARRSLPAILHGDGAVGCPALDGRARSLVLPRLQAAAGLVVAEADLREA